MVPAQSVSEAQPNGLPLVFGKTRSAAAAFRNLVAVHLDIDTCAQPLRVGELPAGHFGVPLKVSLIVPFKPIVEWNGGEDRIGNLCKGGSSSQPCNQQPVTHLLSF